MLALALHLESSHSIELFHECIDEVVGVTNGEGAARNRILILFER